MYTLVSCDLSTTVPPTKWPREGSTGVSQPPASASICAELSVHCRPNTVVIVRSFAKAQGGSKSHSGEVRANVHVVLRSSSPVAVYHTSK